MLSRQSLVNGRPLCVRTMMLTAGLSRPPSRSIEGGEATPAGHASTASSVAPASVVGQRETGRKSRSAVKGLAGMRRSALMLYAQLIQKTFEHHVVVKILASDFSGSAAMLRIVGIDRLDCGENLVHRRKRKQSLASRQNVAEAGFLRDDRPSGGEILSAPFAEPAALEPDVLI